MTYELINAVTTNTIAAFDSEHEAAAAFAELRAQNAAFASSLVLVEFDDDGEAVQADSAADRLGAYA